MDDTTSQTNQETDARKKDGRRDATIGWALIAIMLVFALIGSTTAGFGPYESTAGGARVPTFWDWLQLLVVPAVLALGAILFNRSQKDTELRIAKAGRETEQRIASERLRQTTLETYYDRMTELLLKHKLREADAEPEVQSIAKAWTAIMVRSLDGERNRQLFSFLRASKLIEPKNPVIELSGTDLSGADLRGIVVSGIDLSVANLRRADLSQADLRRANLSGAYLSEANLHGANLSLASLFGAGLREANLQGANLSQANLSWANLSKANLSWVNLREANLSLANLRLVDLSQSDVSQADLRGADLSGATGWTIAQLSLAEIGTGATMPDGIRLRLESGETSYHKGVEGPTFDEWKAQHLATQEAGKSETQPGGYTDDSTDEPSRGDA